MTTMRVVGECFFWYRLTRVFPDKFHRAVKRLCVCVSWSNVCIQCFDTSWIWHCRNLFRFFGCIAGMHRCCFFPTYAACSVMYVGHTGELWKNGWTDQDSFVCRLYVGPLNHVIGGGPDHPLEMADLRGGWCWNFSTCFQSATDVRIFPQIDCVAVCELLPICRLSRTETHTHTHTNTHLTSLCFGLPWPYANLRLVPGR